MFLKTLTICLLFLCLATGDAQAQAPVQLSYQGYLTDAGGVSVNQAMQITVSLYATIDAEDPLWSETHEAIPVSGGLFEVRMGSVAPLDLANEDLAAALSSGDLFLGVQVDDDVEMEPRQRLLSVPWAWRASSATDATTVGGQAPSSFAPTSHTHEGWDVVSPVEQCNEASALSCEECIGTAEIADGSITLADVAGNGCAAGQTFLRTDTGWECGSAQLPQDVLDGLAFDPRFVNSSGDTLAGGLAIVPAEGTPAFLTLTGTGAGGEAAVVLEGAGGAWVVSADDEANVFGVYGGGASRLVIDAAGRVGVGTASPAHMLDVQTSDASSQLRWIETGAGSYAVLGSNNDRGRLSLGSLTAGSTSLLHTTGGWQWSDQLNIMGNVGIGTTAPGSRLEIHDSNNAVTNATPNLAVFTTDAFGVDVGGSLGLGGQYNTEGNRIAFASIHGKKENSTENNALGYFAITTRNAVGTAERFRITSSGNVGIGTTTPTVGLHLLNRNLGVQTDGIWVVPTTYEGTTQFRATGTGATLLPSGTFSSTYDRWKVLLIGSWADDYHGGGAAPHAGWMEFTDQFPTRNIHGRTITITRNADNEFVATSTSTNAFSGMIVIAPNYGSGTGQESIDVRGAIVAGEDALRLDPLGTSYFQGGSVGIGTASPARLLDVQGTAPLRLGASSSDFIELIQTAPNQWTWRGQAGNDLTAVDQLTGTMGIGTTASSSTGARLYVNGGIEASGQGSTPTAYLALLPSSGSDAPTRIQSGGSSPATDIVLAPAGAEALRVTTSAGTQVQGNLFVNATGSMAGSITAAGHIYAHSTLHIGDLAEEFPLAEGERAEAGDVLAIDPEHSGKLRRSDKAYDAKVVGIVSEQPTFRIGVKGGGVPVALVGRAQVKVMGPVQPGDFLVASDRPGHAMRAADHSRGGILGTAMTSFAGKPGELGTVVAFVHLQPAPSGGTLALAAVQQQIQTLHKRLGELEAQRVRTVQSAIVGFSPPTVAVALALVGGVVLTARRRR